MFGKTNLLACGYKTAARAQFEAELAQAREAREAARGWRLCVVAGVILGAVGSIVQLWSGF